MTGKINPDNKLIKIKKTKPKKVNSVSNKTKTKVISKKIKLDKTDSDKSIKNKKPNTKIQQKKSNDFFKELLQKQIQNVPIAKKLTYNDIKRISKFISNSIFDENNCSLWNGYITNEKNQSKGTYINFYFNQKKIALHRLLFLNFVGEILNTEYIKFSCANKGKCCNINHMKKFTYNIKQPNDLNINDEKNNSFKKNLNTNQNLNSLHSHLDNSVHIVQNKNELTIEL